MASGRTRTFALDAGDRKYKTLKTGRPSDKHSAVRILMKNGVKLEGGAVIEVAPEMERAEELRRTASRSEMSMVKHLGAMGFRRSVPMFGYFADFYDHEMRVAIEIDGPCHLKRKALDKRRDGMFRANGIKTWRFKAGWAYGDPDSLAAYIRGRLDLMVKRRLEEESCGL